MRKLLYIFFFLISTSAFVKNSQCQWQHVLTDYGINCSASIGSKLFANSLRGLLVSNDSGSTWSLLLKRSADTDIYALVSIGSNLLASANNGILLSKDSGLTWEQITDIPSAAYISLFRNGSELYVTDYYIYKSIDNGLHWGNLYKSECGFIVDMAAIGNVLFAGFQNNKDSSPCGVIRSTDDGLSWTNSIQGNQGGAGEEYWYFAVIGNKILATVTWLNTAFLSSDTGNTWQKLYIPTPNNYAGPVITSLAVFGSNIFAGYDDAVGGVTLSTDTGKS